MLELTNFWIRRQSSPQRLPSEYAIFDTENGKQVGQATQSSSLLERVARTILGRRWPFLSVKVTEFPEEALVFTIKKSFDSSGMRIEVLDSLEDRLGHLLMGATMKQEFTIVDRLDRLFAKLAGQVRQREFDLVAPDGTRFASVASQPTTGNSNEDGLLVIMGPLVERHPIAKMLLLAAVLAVDILYDEVKRSL